MPADALSAPHAGARFAAVAIGLAASFQFCGYELVRSTANTLYKDAYGAGNLLLIMALVPIGVGLALYVYGRMLSRWGARRTLLATSVCSGLGILACYAGIQAGWKPAAALLYLLREAYIVLLVEQYWSFLDSRLDSAQARKFNGPICGIGSLGSILGGWLVSVLSVPLGSKSMLLLAAVWFVPAIFCAEAAYARCGEPRPQKPESSGRAGHLGVKLFGEHRLLLVLLAIIVLSQVLVATLEQNWQMALSKNIPNADAQTAYSGGCYELLGITAAFGQFVLAPLLLRWLPAGVLHVAVPLTNLVACAVLLGSPTLGAASAAYLLFKTLDYSLFRAVKEMLYIPFGFDVRYRAKEVIDVLGYRCGKGGSALALHFLNQLSGLAAGLWSVVALAAAGLWLILAFPLIRLARTPLAAASVPEPAGEGAARIVAQSAENNGFMH